MVNMDFDQLKEAYKKEIAKHLSERVKVDPFLAEAVKKPGKTLDGVLAYVKAEAKKQAQGNVAVIPDAEVYEWATHYILEDSLDFEPKKPEPPKPRKDEAQKPSEPRIEKPKAEQKQPKKAKTIAEEIQLTLFDF